MTDKRIMLVSNAPWAPTGYGGQAKQLMSRLKADDYEVAMATNWGLTGAPMDTEYGKIFPQGAHPYSLDVIDLWASIWFGGERGRVIILYDTWPLLEQPDLLRAHAAYYWAPVDHSPLPPKVHEFALTHDIIAMSDFGRDEFEKAGTTPVATIPHGIETDTFKPTESDIRSLLRLPEGSHLTSIVMANIGQSPVRKSWSENLLGWRVFADKHPDAYLYIHTQLRHPRGVDLASFIGMWGLPRDRVRIVDQGAYMGGMVTQQDLAAIYTAADVTLMATAGEGFGIPAVESIATGTPVIGTRFSAQTEVIGDCGWLVPWAPIWDYHQASMQALPDIQAISRALEESYELSKDRAASEAMRERCLAHAAQYDADTVYAEQWRPFLESTEAKPNREQRRRKNKR